MIYGDDKAKALHALHRTEHGTPTVPGTEEAEAAWAALDDAARRYYRKLARAER